MKPQDFFKEVGNDRPYFKAAFQGLAGSGKTFTSAQVAIGLHQQIKSTKPIVMFDTEKSNKFLKPLFDEAGIKLVVKESRSLADLKQTMQLMREGYSDVLMIDSISHIWENVVESYKKKLNRTRLQFQDWGILKPTWKNEFSDPLVNDPYHIIFSGRAGFEYGNEINEETGKREIFKSGVKMKVEGETAYEPDLLVLMERFEEVLGHDKKVWREATVLKDRSNLIDGKTFKNPVYEDLKPIVDAMLTGVVANKDTDQADDSKLFRTEEDKYEYIKKRNIVLEKIQNEFTKHLPGQSAEVKQKRVELSEKVFGTNSWTEIEGKALDHLEIGLNNLKVAIKEDIEKEHKKIKGETKSNKSKK